MTHRYRWPLMLATLTVLSVLLLAAGQAPGRMYLPMVAKGWQVPPTSTPTATPTSVYSVAFAQSLSITTINGTEPACRVDNGCVLFAIQVRNTGNTSVRYWLTKQQTFLPGWGVFFCWGQDCEYGDTPPPKSLAPGQRETLTINFRVPSNLQEPQRMDVNVQGYYSCDGCPDPVVYQAYDNLFTVYLIPATVTPTPTSTSTSTPTMTPTETPTPYYGVTFFEDLSTTVINGTEPGCQLAGGCTLFQIQVRNVGNRPVAYQLAKTQTLPLGWASFFCWTGDCEFGNTPPPRILAVGQRETTTLNFRIPAVLRDGDVGTVDVTGTCSFCSQPDYRNRFTVIVALPTQAGELTPTGTPTPSSTPTPTRPS